MSTYTYSLGLIAEVYGDSNLTLTLVQHTLSCQQYDNKESHQIGLIAACHGGTYCRIHDFSIYSGIGNYDGNKGY